MPQDWVGRETETETLRARNAALAAALRVARTSAALQASRAAAQADEAGRQLLHYETIRRSLFWRLTAPARLAIDLLRAPPAQGPSLRGFIAEVIARDGWRGLARKTAHYLRHGTIGPASAAAPRLAPLPRPALKRPAAELLTPHVLILAELRLPQCARYRVWQKRDLIESLGVACSVVDWRDESAGWAAAQTATLAIVYRVPGYPRFLGLLDELHRLGVPRVFELDDLIFDRALYLQNRNVAALDRRLREEILSGVPLYRAAMLACDRGIASTPTLADAMQAAGLAEVAVVENGLDAETLAIADTLAERLPADPAIVRLVYGSGTRTHDQDLALVAPAIAAAMRRLPSLRLRLIGEVAVPAVLTPFADRVERLPLTDHATYLARLAEADISLAPLEPGLFNDAKSSIKLLEAAAVGLPSVCSPRASFVRACELGVPCLLAESEAEWTEALDRLAGDAALRREMGQSAREAAIRHYAPSGIARRQVAPLLAGLDRRPAARFRALLVNLYFAPRSFGGATIVVEEMARRLAAAHDTDVSIVTATDTGYAMRYEVDGMPVFALPTGPAGDPIAEFDNPAVAAGFEAVLRAVRPDVVHLHAMQGLGSALARSCRDAGIPYVISLHDMWWLCARQFMVRADGRHCQQTRIDLAVCAGCVPEIFPLAARQALLRDALDGAAMLLAPTESHRRRHIANGLSPGRIRVHANGVRPPALPTAREPATRRRFAYVGGEVAVKGAPLVRLAFAAMATRDYTLVVVDNTLNLGFASIDPALWRVGGALEIVPAYTQATMDDFFAGIDVLLFPSQWPESFGLTVREALARGVWVIATAGGGAAEAVIDGVNGTIIPLDGSHKPLRAAIEAVLDAPPSRRKPPVFRDYAAQAAELDRMLREAAAMTVEM